MFSCKFSEIFKKTYFVEHALTDARVKWTKKLVFTKSIHRKTPVRASVFVQLQTCGLTIFLKRDSITDIFLWKLGSFTEHQFSRIMLRDYVITWRYNFSIRSVIILVLYYHASIILVLILVLNYYYYISIIIFVLIL